MDFSPYLKKNRFTAISLKQFATLDGKGGLYASGRWHNGGHPILYTAFSRSTTVLERLVHENADTMPKLSLMTIWIPDAVAIKRYTEKQLPRGWDLIPDTKISRDFGTQWLQDGKTAFLQVPSAIVHDEWNILVNPLHPDAQKMKLVDTRDFYYDSRIHKVIR